MGEEVKLKVTADTKDAVQGIEDVGGALGKAGGAVDGFAERLGKMNPKELAERIMSIEAAFGQVGNVVDAVATNDIPKFEAAMSSAMHGVVGVVALVAPQFAPIVAVLTPVITKTLEWALGMQEAAEAAKKLADETKKVTDELEHQTSAIDHQMTLERTRVHDRVGLIGIEIGAINRKSEAEEKTYLKRLEMDNLTEEEIKAHTKFVEDTYNDLQVKQAELADEQQKLEMTALKDGAKEREEAIKEAHKTELEGEREHAQAVREIQAEMIEGQKTGFIAFQNYMTGARFAGAKAAVDADKVIADSAKKTGDAQVKSASDAQQKVVNSYTAMANITKALMTDWKSGVSQLLDLLTKAVQDNMLKQLTAVQTMNSSATVSNASYTASSNAFAGARASAETASIAPKVASAYAGIPFVGVALATAAIAAFFGLIRSKIGLEEGYVGSGRASGMGRDDDINAKINSRESVMNEGSHEALGRMVLDLANRGGGTIPGGNGGGAQKMQVEISFREPGRGLIREIANLMTAEVNLGRVQLTASHLKD